MTNKSNVRRWDFRTRPAARKGRTHPGDWTRFAAAFGRALSQASPRSVALHFEGIEAEAFGDLAGVLTGPRGVTVFRSQALHCPGLLVFSQKAADLLTNLLHGGVRGKPRGGDAALSGVGASLLKRVSLLALESLECELFASSNPLELSLTRQEASIEATPILRDEERTLRARFRLADGDDSGTIDVIFPERAFAVLVDAHNPDNLPDPQLTPAHLESAVADIVAELGSVELTLRELLALAPGDEVLLAQSELDALTVFVEGRPKMTAHAEVRRGRRAVRIV